MDAADPQAIEWALSYDAAGRLSSSPGRLIKLIQPLRNSYAQHGATPSWAGVELLRGWAHNLATQHPDWRPSDAVEFAAVLDALRAHDTASPDDRPPGSTAVSGLAVRTTPRSVALSTQPKMHRDPDFLIAKQSRLREPHVAPINAFVDRIRTERGASVPYIDPDSGGVNARILFILESPARPAAQGSTMLSVDNDDETAANLWRAYDKAALPREWGLHWNAVPWFIGDERREKNVTDAQVAAGHGYLLQLLELATQVRVVIAMGRPAQRSVQRLQAELDSLDIATLESLHPSPRNASRGIADSIPEVVRQARTIAGT